MRRSHTAVATALVGGAIVALGLALAQQEDLHAIEALPERIVAAVDARDAEAMARLYTEDALRFEAGGQVTEGRQAVAQLYQAAFEQPPAQVFIVASETVVHNDSGYQIGTYSVADEDGETLLQGYYLLVLNRVDGEWLIHRQINNMVLPEMPALEGENDGM